MNHAASPLPTLIAFMLGLGGQCSKPPLVGLSAAQGAGKSTLAGALRGALAIRGLNLAVVALDDFYLPRSRRQQLAREVNPLLATRGPPGTHDVAALLETIDALSDAAAGDLISWPRFDKSADDRMPADACNRWTGRPDAIMLEGWCVGLRAQPADALIAPVNLLEQQQDRDGSWRRFINAQLAGAYAQMRARLDALVALIAPDFEIVSAWRTGQEAWRANEQGPGRLHDREAVQRFVAHFERLTRWGIEDLPRCADLVYWIDASRQVRRLCIRANRWNDRFHNVVAGHRVELVGSQS